MAQYLFDGRKTVLLDGKKSVTYTPITLEEWLSGEGGSNGSNAQVLYGSTAFLYAVIQRIANACSAVPLTLNGVPIDDKETNEGEESRDSKKSSTKAKTKPKPKRKQSQSIVDFDIDIKDLIFRWSLSLDLRGAGYAYYESNQYNVIKRVKFCNPFTIYQQLNFSTGETDYFRRSAQNAGARQYIYPYDEVNDLCQYHLVGNEEIPGGLAWCWLPGLNENGPAIPPVDVARNPAAILAAIDQLSVNMFSRGVIKPFLVTAEGEPPPKEKREEIIARLMRSLAGGLRTAFKIDVFPSTMKVTPVETVNLDEMAMTELDKANQEDICVIYNTPRPLVTGDAANKSVYEGQRHEWINNNIIPKTRAMIKALNHHIFEPLDMDGLAIHYEAVPANQEDEKGKAESVAILVGAGETLQNAYRRFGYPELPEETIQDTLSSEGSDKPTLDVNGKPIVTVTTGQSGMPNITATNEQPSIQQQAFNGAQISSALEIITAYNEGVIERDNAVYMLQTFFQLTTDTASKLVPEKKGVVVDSNASTEVPSQLQDAAKSSEVALLRKWARNQYKTKGRVNLMGFTSNVLDSEEIANEAKAVVSSVDSSENEWGSIKAISLTLGDEELDTELADWQEFLTDLSTQVVNGELSQSEYEKKFKNKLKVLLFLLFLRGTGIDKTAQASMSADEKAIYDKLFKEADLLAENEQFVAKLAKDLANGRYNEGGINPNNPTVIGGNPKQTAEAAKVNLANRLLLWVNTAVSAYTTGQVYNQLNPHYRWEYGDTIDHCRTCLTLKDQVHTAGEWKQSGYRPQGRNLECKGYNCDCRLRKVDSTISRGNFMG